ncbi:alpha-amylase family glycosyl hydrolase [Tunturiibacter gelidoferens]|uniref:1,4-alpha-glucan branching enzyme n=1 Tax=Tunturiibacter lichenicola TaxID=2051959 RepID=A0A7Y9T590_9BACT|nr:alpha-amylase family glycosyl hydrolase [Edaphobacter lichenicola]NYF52094.1 1,4-alpha-glucan branching enzyme [Edaphobacter lichenicola]
MPFDLISRKSTHFVLWSPGTVANAPVLIIGQFQQGNPPTLAVANRFPMTPAAGVTGLWEIAATSCGLVDGSIYHYWFAVQSTNPNRPGGPIPCTDPTAWTVDWRLLPPPLASPFIDEDRQPAAVVLFRDGLLQPSDPGGEQLTLSDDPLANTLPQNNQLVIYELPTAWARTATGSVGIGAGSFQDVRALIAAGATGKNLSDLAVTAAGNTYLTDLGINALELLPPADSFFKREWGYDTAHYLAADSELGQPDGNSWPTTNRDLSDLVKACHQQQIRFFVDMVMAFSRNEAYQHIAFDQFCIDDPAHNQSDPDALTSRSTSGNPQIRDGFGSTLFRYTRPLTASFYDPESGVDQPALVPARQHMYTQLTRWMTDFHVDGIRIDSVENVANWDFVQGFKDRARALFAQRWATQRLGAGADSHFLVVGEELSVPLALLTQNRLDGLWNDHFRVLVRAAVRGVNAAAEGEPTFEWTVRKAIDCRNLGFTDGTQAVNYITSHDVEGPGRERLFTSFAKFAGFAPADAVRRIKLAFTCLLTAVGVPMILAGEEFADLHTRFDVNGNVSQDGGKQVAPVHFELLDNVNDPIQQAVVLLRQDLLAYVSRLVHLRTSSLALSVNDTSFLHVDFNDGKRVVVWQRGPGSDGSLVIVLANFSDFNTDTSIGSSAEYVVPNWPSGRSWREITQERNVPANFAGREPIFAWEAKVYVS